MLPVPDARVQLLVVPFRVDSGRFKAVVAKVFGSLMYALLPCEASASVVPECMESFAGDFRTLAKRLHPVVCPRLASYCQDPAAHVSVGIDSR